MLPGSARFPRPPRPPAVQPGGLHPDRRRTPAAERHAGRRSAERPHVVRALAIRPRRDRRDDRVGSPASDRRSLARANPVAALEWGWGSTPPPLLSSIRRKDALQFAVRQP